MARRIFVPTIVDASNLNAQVNNAREILAGWDVPGWEVHALAYHEADQRVLDNPQVKIIRLWRRYAWYAHHFLSYLVPWDLIFYPGVFPMDAAGLRWRRRLGMHAPVIVTLEGLLGDKQREQEYSALAGHPVYCQHVPADVLTRVDQRNMEANHIIAISPFLARMGESRFGEKFSVLPLGINSGIYYWQKRARNPRLQIVAAGGVRTHKRPELMLELGRLYPESDFIWYGDGELRDTLIHTAQIQGLTNVSFPGALSPQQLGEAFRVADIFVMPSKSEGVPKVSQEAAACGLAQVIFGFYEAPSVVDGCNGFVVWDDQQFFDRVGELIANRGQTGEFGRESAEMAQAWDWKLVAPQWRQHIIEIAEVSGNVK